MVKIWSLILYLFLITTLVSCGGGETEDADPVQIDNAEGPPIVPTPLPDFDVHINQRDMQPDPALGTPIDFRLVFTRKIDPSTFTVDDITQDGTANGITWSIISLGNDQSFTLRATAVMTQGTVEPSVSAGLIEDHSGAYNLASSSIDNSVYIDLPLSLTIEQKVAQLDPAATLPIEYDIVFSDPIDDSTFTAADITQNGTATGVTWNIINSGDDINYTLQATAAGSTGTIQPSLLANVVNRPGPGEFNLLSFSADNEVTYQPTYSVTVEQKGIQADPTGGFPVEFDVVFSKAIASGSFDVSDIVQNGTATGITWNLINSGDDTNFTLQATASSDGTLQPSIDYDMTNDGGTEVNAASTSIDNEVTVKTTFWATVDQKGAQADPTAALPIEFDVVFEQAIDDTTFVPADITQNGTATGITWNIINSGDDINFTLQATAIVGEGTLEPSFAASVIQDPTGANNLLSTSTDNYVDYGPTFDVTIEQKGAQVDPSATLPIEFDVVFTRIITTASFTTADITQSGTATGITWNIINSGDDMNFTLQATAVVGEGTIIPSLAALTVQDTIGGNNNLSTSVDNSVEYRTTFDVTVDQKGAQADPTGATPIEFDVVFTDPIMTASFTTADIVQNGTATGITWNIINSGDDTNFTIQATAIVGDGTVTPSINATTITTPGSMNNNASTSTDNEVTYLAFIDVTIEQKGVQADPAVSLPIEYDVVFESTIDDTTFTTADIIQSGTATGITWNIINSGDDINFTLQATAIVGEGTVIPSIAGSVIQNATAIDNNPSTSTDNDVTYRTTFTVNVDEKGAQADPTATLPIEYDVVFSEAIDDTTFVVGDITQNGTAAGITWNIINSGDDINFTLQATAVVGEGTVTPSIALSLVQTTDLANNIASTATDNEVTYSTTFDVTIDQKGGQADPAVSLPIEFDVVFSRAIDDTTFVVGDITQNGTATGITWNIINSGDDINFTLQATAITGEGTVIPNLALSTVQDSTSANNTASTATDNSVLYQQTFDVTLDQKGGQADPTSSVPIEFDVVFSEAIDDTTFVVGDITQNGTATGITWNIINSGDDINFTLQATAVGTDGTVTPSLAASTVQTASALNNNISTSTDNEVTFTTNFDVTANEKGSQADPTNSLPIEFDVVFSTAIDDTTFVVGDITQNGTATGITWNIINSGDDINFTLQATAITGEGTVIPSIASSTVQTSFGADNTVSTSTDNSVTYEMRYTVTVEQKGGQADPAASLPIEFDVVFGQAIDDASFIVGDITQNGTATGITWNIINSGDDTNYTLQATAIVGTGTVIPSLAVDSTTSGTFKNYVSTSTDNSVLYELSFDVTINQKGGQADPASTLPIEFDVVFSEAIDDTTFTTADITQNGSATIDTWNIINSGDDINFTLQATAASADGTVIPSIAVGVVDNGGVKTNTASTATDNTVTLDTSIPISNIVEPVDGSYGEGAELIFQVVYSEAIDITNFPRIPINVGGVTRYANYFQGTGTTGIEFKYIVAAGENDADGIQLQGGSINLNGGTMIGAVTSGAARLSLSGSIDPLTNVLVDTSQLPPDQVTGVTTAPTTSNTEMGVSWSVPANNGTPITHYSVQYREQGTSTWLNKTPNPGTNSTVITGLTAGITYEIRVAASNGVLGPYSAISTTEIFDVMSLNPIAWINATDVNGDGSTPTNGSKVATWVDLTGAATDATEGNTALQPVFTHNVQNGLPAVRFDDLDRGLAGGFNRSAGTDLTIFIVGQYDTGSNNKCMFEFRDVATGNQRAFFIDTRYAGNTTYSPALTRGSFQMWTITNSGTYSTVSEDSSTQLYAGNNDFDTDFTGNGNYYLGDDATGGNRLNGYIGEILIFDKNLTAQEISDLESYFQSKWGL